MICFMFVCPGLPPQPTGRSPSPFPRSPCPCTMPLTPLPHPMPPKTPATTSNTIPHTPHTSPTPSKTAQKRSKTLQRHHLCNISTVRSFLDTPVHALLPPFSAPTIPALLLTRTLLPWILHPASCLCGLAPAYIPNQFPHPSSPAQRNARSDCINSAMKTMQANLPALVLQILNATRIQSILKYPFEW